LAQEGLGIVAEGHFDHGLVDGLQAGDFPRDLVGKFVEGNALENFAVVCAEFAVEAEGAGAFGAEGGDQAAGDDSFEVADRLAGRAGAEGGFEFGGEDRVRLERDHGAAQLEKGIRRGLVDEGEFVEAGEGFFKALEDFFLERFGLGGIPEALRQKVLQPVARAAEPIGAGGRRAGVQMLQQQLHLGAAIGKAALQIPLEHGPRCGIEGVLPLRRVGDQVDAMGGEFCEDFPRQSRQLPLRGLVAAVEGASVEPLIDGGGRRDGNGSWGGGFRHGLGGMWSV